MSWRAGGIRTWIVQRLSAVYLAIGLVFFAMKITSGSTIDYISWQHWITNPFWIVFIIVFWLSLFSHAWIGIRDVIMDYVHPDGLRFGVLAIFGFYLIAMTVWMLKIFFTAGSL